MKRTGNYRHGFAPAGRQTKIYRAWNMMIQRCKSDREHDRVKYKDRGITVCEEWKASFIAFAEHIGPPPTPKHSLDRKDNDKGYEPGNVRWATAQQQARNTRVDKNTLSGRKGVRWAEDRSKWRASICVDGKLIHLGAFAELDAAIRARAAAEARLGW